MQFLCKVFSTLKHITSFIRYMLTLVSHYRVHSEMSIERKKKKENPLHDGENARHAGLSHLCTSPLTYVSVDESAGSNINQWP